MALLRSVGSVLSLPNDLRLRLNSSALDESGLSISGLMFRGGEPGGIEPGILSPIARLEEIDRLIVLRAPSFRLLSYALQLLGMHGCELPEGSTQPRADASTLACALVVSLLGGYLVPNLDAALGLEARIEHALDELTARKAQGVRRLLERHFQATDANEQHYILALFAINKLENIPNRPKHLTRCSALSGAHHLVRNDLMHAAVQLCGRAPGGFCPVNAATSLLHAAVQQEVLEAPMFAWLKHRSVALAAGNMFLRGTGGLPQSLSEATRLYALAAKVDAQAQLELANCYGQQNDCAKSLHFYKLAAANGIADAQQFLAERYYHAVGVPLDYCKVVPEHRAHPLLRHRFCASSFLSAGHEVVCQSCGSRAGQSSGALL